MELSNFRPESYVAQQNRHDKLRQNSTAQAQHLEDYPNNLEQSPDLIQVPNGRYSNISYNPSMFSSAVLNFAANSEVLLAQKDAMAVNQGSGADQKALLSDSSHPMSSIFNSSSKVRGDPQSCDWIVNYSSGITGSESNQNPLFVGEGLTSSMKVSNISSSALYLMPGLSGYHDLQSSITNPSSEISSQNSQKHYEEIHFNSPPLYQNSSLAAVTSAAAGSEGLEMASLVHQDTGRVDNGRGSWTDGGNELLLLPTYGDHQWNGELGFLANNSNRDLRRRITSDCNTQGLSLSLSPVLPTKSQGYHFGEDLHSSTAVFGHLQGPKTLKSDYLCSNSKLSIGSSKVLGNTGPLGPFTGYATILNGSKFLKPSLQLLDEICSVNPKPIEPREVYDKVSDESMVDAKGSGDSVVSSSRFFSSNEIGEKASVQSRSSESYGPEYQQKKAQLLYMQEEVCRRYKQYHQQMQMVVSSFESVAGLSAATPCISLALKTVSRHFRGLKSAILDQLRHIRKGDTSTSRLQFIDHSFSKQKSGRGNLGFYEPQQHVWRPQRGLPERSVAVLRAWLFEHFLHPYPTDTDKHMLATQTGLSRNQVSNWFINARVRVWKPMVEEVHMLETKGLAEANSNGGKSDGKPAAEGTSRPNDRLRIGTLASRGDGENAEQWNQEKRSRGALECSLDGSLMAFMPCQRSGLEIGAGLGAVSLTLGLRQSAETAQQQQQLRQEEHRLRQHFGGQMIHDFGG